MEEEEIKTFLDIEAFIELEKELTKTLKRNITLRFALCSIVFLVTDESKQVDKAIKVVDFSWDR